MREKEKKLASDILGIFERLPEPQQHRLVGVAEGLDMAAAAAKEAESKAGGGEA